MINHQLITEFESWVQALRREIRLIGQAWHHAGAKSLIVMHEDQILASFPADAIFDETQPMLKAPWRMGDEILLLCAVGLQDAYLQPRLYADASLLSRIIAREYDIMQLSDEVIQYQDRLLILYEMNQQLQFQTKLQHILHLIAQQTQRLLDVYHVFIIIDPQSEKPELAQVGDAYIPSDVMSKWYQELATGDHYMLRESTVADTSQLLLIPIETDNTIPGLIGLIKRAESFSMPEIKITQAIVEQGSIHIQKAFLIQERLQQERISVEMNVARDLQMSLLREPPSNIENLQVWAFCRPALEVGGDFYEFEQRGQSFRFSLGDVAGKGISAALLMAMSRTVLKVLQEPTPKQVLERFNDQLYDDFSQVNSFVTLFTAYYDLVTHQLTYANAGHSPVIYCPAEGKPHMLEADSPPIGVLQETMLENHTIQMSIGDVLVVSSDGIPEATQLMGTMLGYQNMLDLIETYHTASPQEIGQLLLKAASMHHVQDDDQTLLIIKRVI